MIDWNADGLKKLSPDDLDKLCSDASDSKKLFFNHSKPVQHIDKNRSIIAYLIVLLVTFITLVCIRIKN